jgi:hypothetical protein
MTADGRQGEPVLRKPYEDPGHATAEQGEVLLDGPDGIAISLTPHAARVTGERLIEAADQAMAQRLPDRRD